MVQAARLDLIRIAAITCVAALAAPVARAQPVAQPTPLLQDRPLTTLLQPQKLDHSRPLLRPSGEGAGSTDASGTRATPCTRQGGAPGTSATGIKPGSAPSVFGGGSGPGDYGRYLPNAAASSGTAPAAQRPGTPSSLPPAQAAGIDRPLYGGTDRPLWDTGDRRPVSGSANKQAPAKAAQPADAATANGASTTGKGATPPRDRPLWADGSLMASTDPSAGAGTIPCVDPAPTTPR